MKTDDLQIGTSDGPMRIYQATPDSEPRGAVIVIAEAFGVNDHIENVTRRVAEAGFVGIAPDIFHRSGGGTAPYDDFRQAMALFKGLDDDGLLVDIDAVREHLASIGFDDSRTGIVGFCFGGRVSFLAGVRRSLGAAVTFYGGGMISRGVIRGFDALVDEAPLLSTPWLGLFGKLDTSIPSDEVEMFDGLLAREAKVPYQVVQYDADHAFHCDARGSYDAESATDAWRRTVDWLGAHLA